LEVVELMSEIVPDSDGAAARRRDEPGAEGRSRDATASDLPDAELAQMVDAVTEHDREFFRLHPERKFRARAAAACEVEDFARRSALEREAPPRWQWYVVIACDRRSSALSRTPFIAVQNAPGEVGEREAREIFKSVSKEKWKELFADAWRLARGAASATAHHERHRES
jgi:hypothetical protein